MKQQDFSYELQQQMACNLQLAVTEERLGDVSSGVYDRVVGSFQQMRDAWGQACGDMEMAALQLRYKLNMDLDDLTDTASVIVAHAEEQVTGLVVDSEEPAMLPYDYKGLARLVQFFNLLTCGQLARRHSFVISL